MIYCLVEPLHPLEGEEENRLQKKNPKMCKHPKKIQKRRENQL
jgi:hypothetical protein